MLKTGENQLDSAGAKARASFMKYAGFPEPYLKSGISLIQAYI